MPLRYLLSTSLAVCGLLLSLGCRSHPVELEATPETYQALQIDVPNVEIVPQENVTQSLPPRTLRRPGASEDWPLTLDDVLQIALVNSPVLRDVGGRVIRQPHDVTTELDPSIQEADPRLGVQAALSAFDAELSTRLFYGGGQRDLNNLTQGQGVLEREFNSFLNNFQ